MTRPDDRHRRHDRGWRGLLGAACLAALTALPLAGPAGAEGRVLTPDQMRATTAQMLTQGQPQVAYDLAGALLQRDPDDVQALLLKSRAARDLGRTDEARTHARRVLALAARHPDQEAALRHAAAMAMAQAHSTDGRRTLAQVWLRRAAQAAPTDMARAQAVRDFRYVRSQNRWSTHLRFTLAPNSNINNGTMNDAAQLYGLPFELALPGATQALSGVELALGGTTRYRLAEGARHATDVILQADTRQFTLSDEARKLAPEAEGSDFASTTLAASLQHRILSQSGRVEYRLGGTLGANTYGGAHYANFTRADLGARIALSRRTQLTLGLQADRTTGPRAPHADAYRLSVGLNRQLDNGAQLGLSLSRTESRSAVDVGDFGETRVGISYAPGGLWLGAAPQMGLDWRWRDYDISKYAPGQGRQDEAYDLYLDLTFRKVDYFGFNPSVTLRSSQQWSSVDLFDIDRAGVQIGVRSAF